jgi:hypothetical protein
VFDQSHIFFDGTWGAALAEIMTNEALSWAAYLRTLPPAEPGEMRPYAPGLQLRAAERKLIEEAPCVTPEAAAETGAIDLEAILNLRRLFKQRSDLLQLTVNDLLLLYRAIHAAVYQPDHAMMSVLTMMTREDTTRPAAEMALAAIREASETNPAVVMPVDASQRSPRDRLYPMTFEVPLADLDLLKLHRQVIEALEAYQHGSGDRTVLYADFDELQRKYLSLLAGFGEVLSRVKAMAITGQSASVSSIKLLAYMPTPLQRMLDRIPGSFDILNDILKGREVFSNVGAVAPDSTLTRFMTAKDDNDKKTLAWGIITDADNVMRISLRDFRPHVGLLRAIGRQDLANQIVQDYLAAYAEGLNHFIEALRQITQASRETQPRRPEQIDV